MSPIKKTISLLGIALHAVWMMFIAYIWLNLPFSYEWESWIMRSTNIVKNVILDLQDKPSRDSLLLINISFDKMLVPRYDADGFESGKIAVTDRASLTRFLEIISAKPNYKFIILDTHLEDSTSYDSTLQAAANKLPAFILPYHLDGGTEPIKGRIHAWMGLADYDSDFGTFLKYRFIQHDTCKTVPLLLYEKFNKGRIHKTGPFYTSSGHLALNAVVLDFPVRTYDIFTDDTSGYSSVHLTELVNLPPSIIHEMTKGKIIVIGDFLDRDLHPTLYGTIAGPLIQLNAYLALAGRHHILTWPLLCFQFVCYFIISWFLLSDSVLIKSKWLDKIKNSKAGGIVFDFIKYIFFLTLINVAGYLIFGVHTNVLILSLYILMIEYIISWVQLKRSKKKIAI